MNAAPPHAALPNSELLNQAILNATVDAIIAIDQHGIIQVVNLAAERIFGYRRDELIGQNVNMLMPAPYRDEHDGYIARYLKTSAPRILGTDRELVAQRKDGSVFPIDLAVSEVEGVGLFTGVIRDISDRKEAEETLRREHEINESMVNTAQNIVLVIDTQGRIVRLNPYTEKLTGWLSAEVEGRDWFETFLLPAERDRVRDMFTRSLAGQRTQGNVNSILTKSGEVREIQWYDAPLTDAGGNLVGLLATGHDVTQRREAEQRLLQGERLSAIGEAMTALAHESRNALQRCQSGLEMLARRVNDRAEAMRFIGEIQSAQDDLARLYEDVREFAKPIKFHPQPHCLDDVIRQAFDEVTESAGRRELRLILIPTDLDLTCEMDQFSIRQVVRNILENSLAACGSAPQVEVEFAKVSIIGKPAIRVNLRDNGPGIETQHRARVFKPFFTTKTHGVGLGMAIARRIVDMHGGEIHVGERGPGAEFVITLPQTQPNTDPEVQP